MKRPTSWQQVPYQIRALAYIAVVLGALLVMRGLLNLIPHLVVLIQPWVEAPASTLTKGDLLFMVIIGAWLMAPTVRAEVITHTDGGHRG